MSFRQMSIHTDLDRLPRARRVVAIGNFDGVHLGHRHLLAVARQAADESGVALAVLTFEPHPARVLAPQVAPPLITTLARKRELLAQCDVDLLVEQPFDLEFAARSPESFVADFLIGGLGAGCVCVGYDFTFGKGRAGTTEVLRSFMEARGGQVRIVPAFHVPDPAAPGTDIVCSSTLVRREVQAGQVERAHLVLGRDMELEGQVVPGAGRGQQLGIPTANLQTDTELMPAPGVYAAMAEILDQERQPVGIYPAAVNVGYNPSFQSATGAPLSVEAHCIRQQAQGPVPDLYGRTLRLSLRAQLRQERRFPSVAALVAQINADIEAAAQVLGAQR